ncbi:hypothetical protein BU25DRAFT_426733 [Macroventuria anomochaeta]|uniref:Uncharacterized protein n=1 Tax=Macroventuria anomochaeta TaxID=301207 RepID=A0ACB6RI91_9PLEO|nr:uncharacterized protein BU25DRAFT_426733 [Macroventuria anomochaeta]KAF2621130.1 hypothetical protein BU25DRAFT_426733 [Macroventuria anomochaeta]
MPQKPVLSHRKPLKYKGCAAVIKKTSSCELRPCERAFAVDACIVGGATQDAVAAYFPNAGGQITIQKVVSTIMKRAKEENLPITLPSFYKDLPRSGRPELLTARQKRAIIKIITQDRAHCEKEPFQAIADGNFKDIVPQMSISTFENILYKACFSRKKPGWKPPLTAKEEQEHYQWALDHNPDLHHIGDGQGFNFALLLILMRLLLALVSSVACSARGPGMEKIMMKELRKIGFSSPCILYEHETKAEKQAAKQALEKENEERKKVAMKEHKQKCSALKILKPSQLNKVQKEEHAAALQLHKHASTNKR